jgi:hypothetical protein
VRIVDRSRRLPLQPDGMGAGCNGTSCEVPAHQPCRCSNDTAAAASDADMLILHNVHWPA